MQRLLLSATFLVLFCSVLGCGAAEVLALQGDVRGVSLQPFMSFYRDASGTVTLDAVRRGELQGREAVMRRDSFGVTPDAVWGRFEARNQSAQAGLWYVVLETSRMDEVDAYVVRSSGVVEYFPSGNMRAMSPAVVDDKYPVFPVRLEGGERIEFFLRIHSETQIRFPLELWGAVAFAGHQARDELFFAGGFSYLLALIVLALITSGITADRGYLIYAAAMGGIFFSYFIASGYYGWFELPGRGFMVKGGLILSGQFGGIMLLAYVRYLLDLEKLMPRLDRWVVWSIRAMLVITPAFLALPYRNVFPLFAGELIFIQGGLLVISLVAWWRGCRAARFYALAWLVFWAFYGASMVSWLTYRALNQLPVVYGMLGVISSGTLFLLAMADRVRGIRMAAFEAQSKVLELERQVTRELRGRARREQMLIRDLHDGIGGLTANVAILAEVGRRAASSPEDEARFESISELASEGGGEVRSLMNSLEAGEMTWPDFFEQCHSLGRILVESHGVEFEFCETGYNDEEGPGVLAGLSLLKIIREALTNAVKHSGCTRLVLTGACSPRSFRFSVRDNGQGMVGQGHVGRGMRNMQLRIQELGGSMSVHNEGGVELVFELPLPIPDNAGVKDPEE